jgi:hypothetical protein
VEQNPSDRRRSILRLISLAVCVALLAGILVAVRLLGRGDEGPLQPHDPMSLWRDASREKKLATAEVLVQEMQDSGFFGPVSQSKVRRVVGRRHRKEEIVTALDDATNIDIPAYVSPSQSMLRTIEDAGRKLGWEK